MNPEGDQGGNQSGSVLQDVGTVSPLTGKRCRSQSEESRHQTAVGVDTQCVKAMDLNLSSDTVLSDGGGDRREDQGSYLDNLTLFQSEKRMKCGPSNLENNSPTPFSSSLTANVDVVASGGGNNVSSGITTQNVPQECAAAIVKLSNKAAEVHTSGIEGVTQFRCDICSVKSTSAKDLETHLAGKRHAKAKELALGMGTSCITKSSGGGNKWKVLTHQKVQASTEHGSTHLNSNVHTASMGQQALADGSGEASKGHYSSDIIIGMNLLASQSKLPDSSDAKAVAMGQHTSIDCPSREVLKNNFSSKISCDNGHKRDLFQHDMNGSAHNPILAEGLLEKICSRATHEEGDLYNYKHTMALLSAKSNSDCVARALASALSTYGCPGLGDLQEGSSCEQAGGSSNAQLGGKNVDGNGLVTMHTRCFSTLLQDVRISVMEDLFRHGGHQANTWLPSAAPISVSAGSGEDLNCAVCRVEYGSKADLDLHLAGRKHASLVQRVYSRCQLCNLNCNTERDFKTHLSGKKHASKLRLVQKRVTF